MKKHNTRTRSKPTALYSGSIQDDWQIFLDTIKDNKVKKGVTKVVAVRTSYIDMLDGDHMAAFLLAQIIYWHLPEEKDGRVVGATKLRVKKGNTYWLAKRRTAWMAETRMSPKQIDRLLSKIEKRGFIQTAIYRFNSLTTQHIRIVPEVFLPAYFEAELNLMSTEESPIVNIGGSRTIAQMGKSGVTQTGKNINIDDTTEITYNIVTYSPSTKLKGSVDSGSTPNSLPSVSHEDSTASNGTDSTFVFVGELSGGDSRNASVEEPSRVSDYSKYNKYAEEGWQLVDQVKNPVFRPLTPKDPYFFHAFEDVIGKPYPWPQDLQNNWVLERLEYVEDEWVDTYFEQKFRKKTNYRVHHFLSEGVENRIQWKNL